jgi:uncharacterized membrane protein YfcA
MSKALQSFIYTVIGMAIGMAVGSIFIYFLSPEKIKFYICTMLFTLVGYTWCLIYHSKAINNEEH